LIDEWLVWQTCGAASEWLVKVGNGSFANPSVILIEWCVKLGLVGDDPATVADLD